MIFIIIYQHFMVYKYVDILYMYQPLPKFGKQSYENVAETVAA